MNENNSVKNRISIIVASHKAYRMPEDPMYVPLHVGAEGKLDENGEPLDLGFLKDNTGDNISSRNPSFCELTGLYWAWKNLESDYIGLVHYRRHFGHADKSDVFNGVLGYKEIEPSLGTIKVFVPKKRKYYIESLYDHYKHTHYIEQLDTTRQIISEKYPDFIPSFDKVVKHTYGYMFNMMIMQRDLLDEYCSWVFDILFELEKRMGTAELSVFQSRFYGRISEIIFNVWLDKKLTEGTLKQSEVKELPFIYMEKVNWLEKGTAFLKAKFLHKKYENSF
ncbi:MAG: DUF4422 domain-containing protein [Lachnospiraceae bacterium]|nr:DUF4422 domain-containing protein [Lachnospiraceae bacterium]